MWWPGRRRPGPRGGRRAARRGRRDVHASTTGVGDRRPAVGRPRQCPAVERLAVAARQLPLLLVAGCRTPDLAGDLATLERGVRTRAGVVFELARLGDGDITELLGMKLGARPGDSLQPVVRQAGGNPLYAIALASDLTRRDAVRVENGVAEADERVPLSPEVSLLAAVDRSLTTRSHPTRSTCSGPRRCSAPSSPSPSSAVSTRTPVRAGLEPRGGHQGGLLYGRRNLPSGTRSSASRSTSGCQKTIGPTAPARGSIARRARGHDDRVGQAAGRGVAEAVELLIGALADPQCRRSGRPTTARCSPTSAAATCPIWTRPCATRERCGRRPMRRAKSRPRTPRRRCGRCIRSGGAHSALTAIDSALRPSGTTPPRGHSVRPAGQQVVHPSKPRPPRRGGADVAGEPPRSG